MGVPYDKVIANKEAKHNFNFNFPSLNFLDISNEEVRH